MKRYKITAFLLGCVFTAFILTCVSPWVTSQIKNRSTSQDSTEREDADTSDLPQAEEPETIPDPPSKRDIARSRFGGTEESEASVMRALRWLKSVQNSDGSWPGQPTAMTGFALLTFLGHAETGNLKDSAEFTPTIEKGIRYLIDNQKEDGLFKSRDGNNYSHPIATYALCEAYSATRDPEVKTAAEKALGHVIQGQHLTGGWDYKMRQTDRDDTSYGSWCAQAVKAGYMAGNLDVENLEEVYNNIAKGFQNNAHPEGGFGYTSSGRGGLSGSGAYCMQISGFSEDQTVTQTLRFLDACTYSFENWEKQPYGGNSPFYYWYFITHAKFNKGGEYWTNWNEMFQPELIKRQIIVKDAYKDLEGRSYDIGYWDSPSEGEHHAKNKQIEQTTFYKKGIATEGETTLASRVQDTCLCALQLMVYYRYKPVFENQ